MGDDDQKLFISVIVNLNMGMNYSMHEIVDVVLAKTEDSSRRYMIYEGVSHQKDARWESWLVNRMMSDSAKWIVSMLPELVQNLPSHTVHFFMNHEDDRQRASFYTARKALSKEELESGLRDKNYRVRIATSSRRNFIPTEEQYRKGLKDTSKKVRKFFEEPPAHWQNVIDSFNLKKIFSPESGKKKTRVL
jgi:hypothetical protein